MRDSATSEKERKKEEKAAVEQRLIESTAAFADARLNAEYKKLAEKVIMKLGRKREVPFLRGRPEIWAAGVIHALGYANFLFDQGTEPYVSLDDIATHFGVSNSAMTQKSKRIRETLKIDRFNAEFATEGMKEHIGKIEDMFLQMAGLTMPGMGWVEAESEEGEFIDEPHAVSDAYYDLLDRYDTLVPPEPIQREFRRLIQADPDFYDPYLILAEALDAQGRRAEADEVLDEAYERAVERVTGGTENWPKKMEWGWIENRHIMRTFLNKALRLWENDSGEALALLRRLLRMNPTDNVGARDYIMAIRLGMTLEEFETRFELMGGYDAGKLIRWFGEDIDRFPDEFEWWKEAVGYKG